MREVREKPGWDSRACICTNNVSALIPGVPRKVGCAGQSEKMERENCSKTPQQCCSLGLGKAGDGRVQAGELGGCAPSGEVARGSGRREGQGSSPQFAAKNPCDLGHTTYFLQVLSGNGDDRVPMSWGEQVR